jgi:hypothetical protein
MYVSFETLIGTGVVKGDLMSTRQSQLLPWQCRDTSGESHSST